jgi:hypothetical protein
MILAVSACGKAKQAVDADSAAFVAAMEEGDRHRAAEPVIVVPTDLVAVAIAATRKEKCEGKYHPTCKDIAVSAKNSGHRELKPADRANGYDDRWCVTTTYLQQFGARERWMDEEYTGFYAKHGGAWHWEGEIIGTC